MSKKATTYLDIFNVAKNFIMKYSFISKPRLVYTLVFIFMITAAFSQDSLGQENQRKFLSFERVGVSFQRNLNYFYSGQVLNPLAATFDADLKLVNKYNLRLSYGHYTYQEIVSSYSPPINPPLHHSNFSGWIDIENARVFSLGTFFNVFNPERYKKFNIQIAAQFTYVNFFKVLSGQTAAFGFTHAPDEHQAYFAINHTTSNGFGLRVHPEVFYTIKSKIQLGGSFGYNGVMFAFNTKNDGVLYSSFSDFDSTWFTHFYWGVSLRYIIKS